MPQSDFYAIGVILYRMMTGVLPFVHDDVLEVAMLHMTEPPKPPRELRPEINSEIEAVILKCLAKEPQDRYASGAVFVAALEKAGQKDIAPLTVPALSIMERVALDMERLPPPPPITDGAATPVPAQTSPVPPTQQMPEPDSTIPAAAPSEPPTKSFPISPKILAIGSVVLLLLLIGGYMLTRGGEDAAVESVETAVPAIANSEEEPAPTKRPVATKDEVDSGKGETAVVAVNDPVVESASDPIPEASSNTDTNVFLPAITSGSDVEETNQEADTSPTSALTPVPTTVPDPTAAPTATAEPSSLTLGLAVERDKDTLFVTNLSEISFTLAGVTFIFKGDEQFAAWPDVNFTPGSCVLIVKEDKNVSDKMDKTVCEQIVGTVEQDWKDDFDVFYAGMEIDSCKVKGNNGSCAVEWTVPSGGG